ncbi:MAG TPA: photosynthetic reaction center cytochrome c subunit family protein [Bryobacteraceae bacterium]|nr:photosynthetic reaction center cytochrome c subunit family protein [Bryobacteraceae bacterium]
MLFRTLLLLTSTVYAQQHPNFSGIWQLNLEKTKLPGPPPKRILLKVDHHDPTLETTILATGSAGPEVRNSSTYKATDEEVVDANGQRMRSHWEGADLVVETTIKTGDKEIHASLRLSLSGDAKELTLTQSNPRGSVVMSFEKAPTALAAEFDKPEKTGAEAYQNVRLLGNMPASGLLAVMRGYTQQLGVDCNHCHVPEAFEKDDKPAKVTARKMIEMVRELEQNMGAGKVNCYTCHRGAIAPKTAP